MMKVREKRIASLRELWGLVREDLRYNGGVTWPGFQALALYRFGVWKNGIGSKLLRIPFTILYRIGYIFVRNFYGIELPASAEIGRRLTVGHQHGITVHWNSVIGDDCIIRQGVSLGQDRLIAGVPVEKLQGPKFGNRVEVGAGAIIIGDITVGDGVRIGPNSVVMANVPAGAIVTAPPSRIMAPPPKRRPKPDPAAETVDPPETAPEPEIEPATAAPESDAAAGEIAARRTA